MLTFYANFLLPTHKTLRDCCCFVPNNAMDLTAWWSPCTQWLTILLTSPDTPDATENVWGRNREVNICLNIFIGAQGLTSIDMQLQEVGHTHLYLIFSRFTFTNIAMHRKNSAQQRRTLTRFSNRQFMRHKEIPSGRQKCAGSKIRNWLVRGWVRLETAWTALNRVG